MTRLLLAAALLCAMLGAAAAAPPPRGRGPTASCPMSRTHSCCKKARRAADPSRLAPVRLCCIVNNQQPAPTQAAYTVQPSPGAASDPRPPATPAPAAQARAESREYAPRFRPSHSPPAYVRHAAFLI